VTGYNPHCWHCTNPRAYWATCAAAVTLLLVSIFPVLLLVIWAAMAIPVAAANVAGAVRS